MSRLGAGEARRLLLDTAEATAREKELDAARQEPDGTGPQHDAAKMLVQAMGLANTAEPSQRDRLLHQELMRARQKAVSVASALDRLPHQNGQLPRSGRKFKMARD